MRRPTGKQATLAVACVAVVVVLLAGLASDRETEHDTDTAADRAATAPRALPVAPPGAHAERVALRGRVLDPDGRPVGGATIRLDLEELGVTSAADGTFAFDAAEPGRHIVDARTDTMASDAIQIAGDRVVLRLRRGFVIAACAVAAATGDPVDTAEIALVSAVPGAGDRASIVRAVDASGCVTFPAVLPGAATLVARAAGMAPRRVVVDPRSTTQQRYRIELVTGIAIAGSVVDDRGVPIAGATVVVSPTDDAAIYPEEAAAGVASDDAGRFLYHAEPARWFVKAAASGFAPARIAIDARGQIPELTIALVRHATVRGRVVDARGTAIAGATVAAVSGGRVIARTVTETGGSFTVRAAPDTTVRLVAATDDATSDPRDAVPGHAAEVVLALVHDGAIAGQVVDDRGAPVAGATVGAAGFAFTGGGAIGAPEASPLARSATCDAEGRFAIRGLERATERRDGATTRYLLTAWYRPDDDLVERTSSAPVEARAGEVVKIIVPSPARLRGRVIDAAGRPIERFTVQPPGAPARSVTSADGAFVLAGLRARRDAHDEPGVVTIAAAGSARQIEGVVLRSGETTDLGVIVMP